MKSAVKRAADAVEFATQERCFITEIANDDEDPGLSIALARVQPGVATAWHAVSATAERYLIIQGRGRVEVGDQLVAKVGQGDVVRIAAGERQRIVNCGDVDLLFYALCTPRFEADNYVDLEP